MQFVVFVILLVFKVSWALKIVRLDVPSVIRSGEPAWLVCLYELQNDQIYSVKWYKNNVEIYSFLPSEANKQKTYNNMAGVSIDLSQSNLTHVYLNTTDHHSEGKYRCEVSAESPSFQTERAQKDMLVYAQPDEKPVISGLVARYEIGSSVNASCSYGPSKPNVVPQWLINGLKVPENSRNSYSVNDSLFISTTRLYFITSRRYFKSDGTMNVTCIASASLPYNVSSNEIVIRKQDGHEGAIETAGPVSGEVIVKTKSSAYKPGNNVKVNCQYKGFSNNPRLQWLINDKETQTQSSSFVNSLQIADGDTSDVLTLSFVPDEKHFMKNELHLKCISRQEHQIQSSNTFIVSTNLQEISQLQLSDSRSSSFSFQYITSLWLLWLVFLMTSLLT